VLVEEAASKELFEDLSDLPGVYYNIEKMMGMNGNVGGILYEGIVWYFEEKSRRLDIVKMLDVVNLPVGRTLKRGIFSLQ